MVSPPFNISTATPGDTDIVSQFPANERTNRDTTQSWLLINHDTNGKHPFLDMPNQAVPPAVSGANNRVYMDTDGNLVFERPDGVVIYVGPPPGSVFFSASSTLDNGYLRPDGSAVSRVAFPRLFARIGTTYGAGDGSTTFNLPDIRGRYIASVDGGAGRLNVGALGTAAVLGAAGGFDAAQLIATDIPAGVPASGGNSIVVVSANFVASSSGDATPINVAASTGAGLAVSLTGGLISKISSSGNNTINVTTTTASQTSAKRIPPTIVLLPMIKF